MIRPSNDFLVDDLARLVFSLAEALTSADDFLRFASAGEPIRRAVAFWGVPSGEVVPRLAAYEAALLAFRGPLPSTLAADALAVAAELSTCGVADDDPDGDEALALLLELDALVSTIVAAERVGRLPHGTIGALAVQLEEVLLGAGARAPQLAQLAEDRWLTVGDDAESVGAYGWLDILAEAAPSRVRISAVVRAAADRQQRIDDVLARLG